MSAYKKRILDEILEKRLKNKGALLVEGAKWCGKTTTCEEHAQSTLYMDDPENKAHNLSLADINPKLLLQGETPRLIDEWQIAPKLWDSIRFEVDHRKEFGQFLLTGSAVPADTRDIFHSGTGRFTWIKMRPMTLFESGESNGSVSIHKLFEEPESSIEGVSPLSLEDITFLICRGGWPLATLLEGEDALIQAYDYLDGVVRSDISQVDGVSRNEERAKRIMRSYARNQGTQISNVAILEDVKINEETAMSMDSLLSYLNALRRIFVIEDMSAWNPNLRSRTAIRTSDTRYFVDPSIAAAALGIGPGDLINDLKTCGFLFETLCIRDLRVFADYLDGTVSHFRNKAGLECDAVLHLRNGSYGLIEVKLGGDKLISEGVDNLNRLSSLIDTDRMKAPSFRMILTATSPYAYRRDDGIYIVPIGCLRH